MGMQYVNLPVQALTTTIEMPIQNWQHGMHNAFKRLLVVLERAKEIATKIGWWAIVVNRRWRLGECERSIFAAFWIDVLFSLLSVTILQNFSLILCADHFRTAITACVQSSIIPRSLTTFRPWRRVKCANRKVISAMHPIGLVTAPFAWGIFKWLTKLEEISERRISIVTPLRNHHIHRSPSQLFDYLFLFFFSLRP